MFRETIIKQLQFSGYVTKANVGGITEEQALIQPQPAGNCVNWVLGHLVASRNGLLTMFGAEPVWTDTQCARYERHGAPIIGADGAEPLETLWEAFDLAQARLLAVLETMPEATFAEKASFSPSNDPNETVGSLLVTIAFHEAYHAGQTGLLRRIVGLPPADL